MTTVIDTLRIYERLKAANLNEEASKEIAEVFREAIDEQLVTRQYLDHALEMTKAELKYELIKWVAGMLVAQAAVVATLVKLL